MSLHRQPAVLHSAIRATRLGEYLTPGTDFQPNYTERYTVEQFAERLSQLADLSDEDLEALESELVTAFDEADNGGEVDAMQEMADALDQVREELNKRQGGAEDMELAEEPVAAAAETSETTAVEPSTAETDESITAETEIEEAPTAAPTEVEATDDIQTEATAEVAEPTQEDEVSNLTADEVPAENQPVAVAAAAAPTIRVGGDVPGFTAGAELADMDQVIDAMTAKVNSMRGIGGDGEHVLVASIRHEDDASEEKILRPGDPDGNSRKIRALLQDPDGLTPEALTAAGWCAPKMPVYDVPTIGTSDRPIRNALPSFNADRGGITWMTPPTLAGVRSTNDDKFAVWDKNTDKPCYTIPCGTTDDAELEALTMCLCFDNMMTRAFPEWVRANTELTMVAQAQWAEQYLMTKMWGTLSSGAAAGSVIGTPDISLGVARDFLTSIRVVASQFRWSNRLSPTAPLQLMVPSWLNDAIAADLAIQAPGDGSLSVSYGEIAGYLSELNVQPIWYTDDVPAGLGADNATTSASDFDSPLGFPAVAEWLLFPTGTFVRLDGGSLDLGVVRSKEDVQQNKYCEFSETFETVAYMGPSTNGWAVRGTTSVNILGAAPDSIDTSGGFIVEGAGS